MLSAQLDNRKAVAGINQAIPETIASIRTIRLYHRESFMEERYGKSVRAGFDAMNRSNLYDSIYSPIIITVSSLIIAIMVVLSVSRSDFQALFGMSAGTAVALISYVGKVFSPLESIGMEIQNIQSAIAGCKRIGDFLSEKEMEPPSAAVSEKEENIPISIRHLSFAYEDGKPVFHNFDLTIHEGENVTLIGRTGSGKSTLFKLICGLYQPSEGTVRIFGRAPESIPEEERRKVFGLVEQQFKPVSGNMRDQITLSDPSISEEDVRRALAETGILPAIEDLPEGLDTPYDPGLLSQGQFQLLSIARATVTNPPLLLLDEITANLDSVTEKQVLDALRAASEKRTVLSISHRLFEAAGGRQVRIGH
jgi:putative ABC transporter, permease/ATP-binding protein